MSILEKLKTINTKYLIETREVLYWESIHKKFKKKQKKNIKNFAMTFKHKGIMSPICYDDELKIESIAQKYGFKLLDEKLTIKNSTYKFENIK